MKRALWILATTFVAVAALSALLIALLPRETLKTRMGEQIAAWTGRDVSLRGEPELSFFPDLTVTLKDVQIAGPADMPDSALVSMDKLTGTIRLLPLLIGRVEIGSFAMVRPRIRLVIGESGERNWEFDSGAAALQLAFAGDVPLGDFLLEDGTVLLENRRDGGVERLDSTNLAVDWPSVRQPLSVSGSGIWRGEQVNFAGEADAPFDFLRGHETAVEARLDSAPIAVAFEGVAANRVTTRLEGGLQLSTPSLRNFASWLGSPIGPGSTLGQATLSGTSVFSGRTLSVENAELTLDGNSGNGALQIATGQPAEVTGTLAFNALDLKPYFAGFAPAFDAAGNWRQLDISTDWFHDLDMDVRLSAGSVNAGELVFGETAASLLLSAGRLEIGIAHATFHGGGLTGDLAVTDKPGAPLQASANLRAADFDLASAVSGFEPSPGLAGRTSVATEVSATGDDLGGLVDSLSGTARITLADGGLPLFGLAELESAADAVGVPEGIASTTPVNRAQAVLRFADGVATVEDASLEAPSLSATATGSVGLGDGAIRLGGIVTPASDGAAPVPFLIQGTMARPVARMAAIPD